jgi:hypothetical protein
MNEAEVVQQAIASDQRTLFNFRSEWKTIDTIWAPDGEVRLQEIVMGDGHRYWRIMWVDEKGEFNRGFATRWSYAKKAFNTAGRNTWV